MIKATLKDLKIEAWLRNRNNGALVWVDRFGKAHPIKDMTDEYINRVINFLRKAEVEQVIYDDAMDCCDILDKDYCNNDVD